MNLPQLYAFANSKSGYARSDGEIYGALDGGGQFVYNAVVKEFRGTFLKFDTTSLTLTPTQLNQEYALPADLTQIVQLSERATSSESWHPMGPLDLGDAVADLYDSVGWDSFYSYQYGSDSPFGYYGPYLEAAAAQQGQALQIQKIRVAPIVDIVRFTQIAYTAKWLPITDGLSKVMLPDEGTHAMLDYAIAELRRSSDDSASREYEAQGDKKLNSFLTWLRARQIQAPQTIATYGP